MYCGICGFEVLPTQGRITYYRTSFHPICFVNRLKQLRKEKPDEKVNLLDFGVVVAVPLSGTNVNSDNPTRDDS